MRPEGTALFWTRTRKVKEELSGKAKPLPNSIAADEMPGFWQMSKMRGRQLLFSEDLG
jgi:hypothetical protein